MKPIKQTLMERDDLSEEDVKKLLKECLSEMKAAIKNGEPEEADEIFRDYTGLEPDYIFELDIW